MKYNSVIRKAIFLRRPNRFQAYVILDEMCIRDRGKP